MREPGEKGRGRQGHERVLRGGSWIDHGRNLRSANRNGNSPDKRNHNIGLRLAGASWGAGGSMNQHPVLFHWSLAGGRSPGLRCVSRPRAESLPVGRLISGAGT